MKHSTPHRYWITAAALAVALAFALSSSAQPTPAPRPDGKTPSSSTDATTPTKALVPKPDATAPKTPQPTGRVDATTPAPKPGPATGPRVDARGPAPRTDVSAPKTQPKTTNETDDGTTTAPTQKTPGKSGTTGTKKPGPKTPVAPSKRFEQLLTKWETTVVAWKRLRQQRLSIVSTHTKPAPDEDLKKRLSERYRQLLSKRRSNRQWHSYWRDEKQFADTLRKILEEMSDVAPKYVGLLIKAVNAERKAYQQTVKPTLPELKADGDETLKKSLAELKSKTQATEEALKTATKGLAEQKKLLAEQQQKHTPTQTPDEKKALEAEIAKTTAAISEGERVQKSQVEALATLKRQLYEAEQLLMAHLHQPPEDAILRKLAQRLAQQQKEVAKRQQALAGAVSAIARSADDFVLLKDELESITGDRFVALEKTLGELRSTFVQRGKEVFAASKEVDKTLGELEQLVRSTERNKKLFAKKLESATQKREEVQRHADELKARIAKIKADKKRKNGRKELRKLEAAHKKLLRELRTLTVETEALKKSGAKIATALRVRTIWRGALQHRAKPTGYEAFDEALRRFDAAHKDADERTQQRISSGAQLLEYYATLAKLVRHSRQANERQGALKGWTELATSKMKNQDRYLQAINISINAVDRRLKQMIDDTPSKKKPDAKVEKKRDLNPYQKYEARLDELARQREQQLANQRQADLNQRLVRGEIKSSTALREAQTIDLRLAEKESKLSEDERKRVAATPFESKQWLAIWTASATSAKAKKTRLTDELDKTLAELKALEVDKQYVDYQKELHRKEIARIDKEVVATKETRVRALRDTVTNWFKQNAWDLPIGFLLAWILWVLSRTLTNTVVDRAKKRERASRATVQQVETLARIAQGLMKLAIILVTLFWFLKRLGVNVTPLLGGAAIFGLAISFGSQNLVRDVVTGFFILLEKQYAVGDVIQVGEIWGEVEQLTLRRTVIRGRDGKAHIIPNGVITQVSNLTLGWSVAQVHVGVAYKSDLNHVRRVVDRVGDEMYEDASWKEKFLEGPPRYVGLTEMADSALVIRVKVKTKPFQNWPIQLELNHRLKEAFDAEGIEIPFPQRDVHMIQPK